MHVTVLLLVRSGQGEREAVVVPPSTAFAEATLDPSCVADEALASAARLAFCATPFAGDPDACADQAIRDFRLGVVACRAATATISIDAEPVKVALLSPEFLDKLEPMPLMPLDAPEESLDVRLEKLAEEKHEEAKKAESRPVPSGQVVEVTRPELEVAPDEARFVSEYDSKVDKQTVARGTTEEMTDRPAPRAAPRDQRFELEQPDRPPTSPGAGTGGEGVLSMRKPGLPGEQKPANQLGPREGSDSNLGPDGLSPSRGDGYLTERRPTEVGEGGGEAGGGPPSVPNLRPTEEQLERVAGGGSVDFVDGIGEGETTALNSKRWKYAGFFNRLKRQVAQNWHPDVVYGSRDPRGNVYGTKDRITVLNVALNKDGSVASIYISKASGVDFLDDEAVRAFRAAQPFPNPPGGLATGERELITFSFGFHFQIGSSRVRWQFDRYR